MKKAKPKVTGYKGAVIRYFVVNPTVFNGRGFIIPIPGVIPMAGLLEFRVHTLDGKLHKPRDCVDVCREKITYVSFEKAAEAAIAEVREIIFEHIKINNLANEYLEYGTFL